MNGVSVAEGGSVSGRPGWIATAALLFSVLISLVFVAVAALPYYLRMDQEQFQKYWPMRGWLLTHNDMGMVALLAGPVPLWLGLSDRSPALHKNLGLF